MRREKLRAVKERAAGIGFLCAAAFSVAAVFLIIVFMLIQGVPGIAEYGLFKFLFGKDWRPDLGSYGILNFIVGTVYVTAAATVLGGAAGILTAVFLGKFCPKFIRPLFGQLVNLLAAIPSIVYGLFGLVVLVPMIQKATRYRTAGVGILPSALILALMIMPIIVGISKNAVDAVPESYYEGAAALGASRAQAVFKVVVPAAKSGIFSSVVLGVGRALGETMAVIMVVGNNAANFPAQLVQPIRTLTTNIVLEFGEAGGELHRNMLLSTGLVLLFFILAVNLSITLAAQMRERRRAEKGKKPAVAAEKGGRADA
ncbi:MAG: phosphate ABC transporter permease subunit PstC [Clostridiales bacterium]|jgi:phosphate transport system permease protein|nr:phosphate ABC transporter permease subunit PstC [Clostridiales bacterium]